MRRLPLERRYQSLAPQFVFKNFHKVSVESVILLPLALRYTFDCTVL